MKQMGLMSMCSICGSDWCVGGSCIKGEADLNKKLREDLCTLLGLSKAISNIDIYEAVEMLYDFYKARKEDSLGRHLV